MKLINFLQKSFEQIRITFKEKKEDFKAWFKNFKLKNKKRIKQFISWLASIDLDWLFVFAASYIFTYQYEIIHRILFSVGITHFYKYMFIKKIQELIVLNNMRKK